MAGLAPAHRRSGLVRGLRASTLALLAALAVACGRPAVHQQESFVFGTQVQVTVAGVDEAGARKAAGAVLAEFDRLHRLLHAWQPSEITALNDAFAAGRPHRPPAEVLALIVDAQVVARQGDYLFDPGIGRLVKLWGFHGDEFTPKLPDPQALAAWKRAPASIADVTIDGDTVRSRSSAVAIDLGGYAKGVALDRAAAILRAQGVANALINIGGNVLALGSKNGTPWKVGIRDPAGSGYLATLDLADGEAIGTSGDYQRYFELDGRRYSHLLDPRTAEPAQGTRALTLLVDGKDAGMRSDALSKPVFIAGREGWTAMAARLGVERVLRVDADGRIAVTAKMAGRLAWPQGAMPPQVVVNPSKEAQ
jgi:thiamine biosynthesis lipoprotein